MVLDDELRVMVDGLTLTDFTVLARMPASDLLGIEVLSGMDATTYYGTNYPSGLIRIRTKTGGQSTGGTQRTLPPCVASIPQSRGSIEASLDVGIGPLVEGTVA
ncbi:MAG TPA: hypothetical protein VEU73_15635 [Gemmatimonadales bacterium]|nr:hypothetical protein [Gemmatimonadales bacterium]